jgi:hypothetical protein
VPSRIRSILLPCVGDELAVDDVGQAAFEAAQGFHGCFAGGELATVVGRLRPTAA